MTKFLGASTDKLEAFTYNSQELDMMDYTHSYLLLITLPLIRLVCVVNGQSLEIHYVGSSCVFSKSYVGHDRVCVANGQSLEIYYVGSSCVFSKSYPSISLKINDTYYVPCITRNLLLDSIFLDIIVLCLSSLLTNVTSNLKFLNSLYLEAFFTQSDCIAFHSCY